MWYAPYKNIYKKKKYIRYAYRQTANVVHNLTVQLINDIINK